MLQARQNGGELQAVLLVLVQEWVHYFAYPHGFFKGFILRCCRFAWPSSCVLNRGKGLRTYEVNILDGPFGDYGLGRMPLVNGHMAGTDGGRCVFAGYVEFGGFTP